MISGHEKFWVWFDCLHNAIYQWHSETLELINIVKKNHQHILLLMSSAKYQAHAQFLKRRIFRVFQVVVSAVRKTNLIRAQSRRCAFKTCVILK